MYKFRLRPRLFEYEKKFAKKILNFLSFTTDIAYC